MSSFLILGGSSFSGNHIAASLTSQHKVVNMCRNTNLNNVFKNSLLDPKNYHEYAWNLNEPTDQLENVMREHEIEVVINFAAQSMVSQSWENPEDWYEANLVGLARVIRTLSASPFLKKYINFTTPEVYGSTEGWVKESFNFAPNTPYAVSRAAADWHLKSLYENFDFPVIFTRAANVYGEHQQLYRIIPKVILSALTKKRVPLQGGGKSIRSFIHISDVYSAMTKIIALGQPGETYHISTKELVTISDLVKRIAAHLDVDFDDLIEVTPDRPGKDFAYQLDSEKIRTELKWSDEVTLEEGIDRTISWVKSNLTELKGLPTEYIHRR